jgi:hypothetical protein
LIFILFNKIANGGVLSNDITKTATRKLNNDIIAFDCGNENEHYTAFSKTNENCDSATKPKRTTKIYGQVLHKKKYSFVEYNNCYIHIKVQSYRCVTYPFLVQQLPLPAEEKFIKTNITTCQKIFEEQSYYNERYDFRIKLTNNVAHAESIVLAGKGVGKLCIGENFVPLRNKSVVLTDIVAFATVNIKVSKGKADLDSENDKLYFPDGTSANYTLLTAFNHNYGYFHWKILNNKELECEDKKFFEIFRGELIKLEEELHNGDIRTSYFYNHSDREFYLIPFEEIKICQHSMLSTQAESLFLILGFNETLHNFFQKINFKNIDSDLISAMAVSALDNKVGNQMNQLRDELAEKLCKNGEKMNFDKFSEPGYVSIERGEIIYIKKCASVLVKLRSTKECYNDIPVTFENQNLFIQAKTKNLVKHGKQISCSPILIPEFKFGNLWYKLFPNYLEEVKSPPEISSSSTLEFEYKYNNKKISATFLSPEQKQELKKIVENEMAKDATSNAIVKAHQKEIPLAGEFYADKDPSHHLNNFVNMFGSLDRIWTKSEALLGFFFILIELVVLSVIFGFITSLLYNIVRIFRAFGFTWKLIFFLSNSITDEMIKEHTISKMQNNVMDAVAMRNQLLPPFNPTAPNIF